MSCPPPWDLPNLGIKHRSLALQADSLPFESPGKVKVIQFATPWTVAHQAPLSVGFSRKEYWTGLPFPSPRDLPNPGIEPGSPVLQADSLPSELPEKPLESLIKDDLQEVEGCKETKRDNEEPQW